MPPKGYSTDYTDEQADLTNSAFGTTRFQWQKHNPKVTVLSFDLTGDCENVKTVPAEHARYLWSKLIRNGWVKV